MKSPISNAFPTHLRNEVNDLSALIDGPSPIDNTDSFAVKCDGEMLQIPYRIYRPVISDEQFASLSPLGQRITACWFTRHHDGHVRERFLLRLPDFEFSWVIAYVVSLCGEYIVEILDDIWERRTLFDVATLSRWLRDNPEFHTRARRRAVSYWNCYYRPVYPCFQDYVGGRLMNFFDDCV